MYVQFTEKGTKKHEEGKELNELHSIRLVWFGLCRNKFNNKNKKKEKTENQSPFFCITIDDTAAAAEEAK